MNSPKIVAIANQKGGVAKTATSTNIAAALAELGRRVLLIDIDPQGQSSHYAGLRTEKGSGTYHVLCDEAPVSDVARPSSFGFDVLTGCRDLAEAHDRIGAAAGGHFILQAALEQTGERYETVIIDCPPSLGHLTLAAFGAAHSVVVPTLLKSEAIDGLGQLHSTLQLLRQRAKLPIELRGVLVAQDDRRSGLAQRVYAEIAEKAGGLLLRGTVRIDVSVSEAFDQQRPVLAHAPSKNGARDYRAVAAELIERGVV